VPAFAKMCGAIWVAVRLYRSRLLPDRTLVIGAVAWCATVIGLAGVLAWWIASQFFPRYLFVLVAILAVPLVRLAAAPLALDWNRHR
jgi:MFS family permease